MNIIFNTEAALERMLHYFPPQDHCSLSSSGVEIDISSCAGFGQGIFFIESKLPMWGFPGELIINEIGFLAFI